MTVSALNTRNDITATSGQATFTYTFMVLAATDMTVYQNGALLASGYTVTGVGSTTGGTVVLDTGALTGQIVSLVLAMPLDRTTDYQNSGDFLASDVNADFDKIYIGAIQNENWIDRGLRLQEVEPTIAMTLPLKADRVGKYLFFNATTGVPEAAASTSDNLAQTLVDGNTTGGTDIAVSAGDDITFTDTSRALFGTSGNLEIYHDGYSALFDNQESVTKDTQIKVADGGYISLKAGNDQMIQAAGNSNVSLYYDGAPKIATTATGIDVTGISVSDGMSTNTLGTSNFIAGVNAGNSMLAGSLYNVIVGDSAGRNITTGDSNIAIGYRSLESSTAASGNTAVGYTALRDNTSGTSNTGVGAYALLGNPTGSNNSAFGYNSLGAPLNTGNYNSGFGGSTLSSNIGGAFNTGIGAQSLSGNTEGDDNTSVGYQSLNTNTTGSKNLCIGKLAGKDIITGSNNTIIGEYTGSASLADTVVICSGTTPRIIINSAGDASIQDGNLNIATTSTPASATATGITGTIAWDASYVYVCTATNTWKRTAISTW